MADKKITALTELTEPAGEDLVLIVDQNSGSPVSRRVTVNNIFGATTVGGTALSKLALNVAGTSDITSTGAATLTATAGLTVSGDVTLNTAAFSSTNTSFDVTTTTSDINAGTSITLDAPSINLTRAGGTDVSVTGTVEVSESIRAAEHLVLGSGSIPAFGVGVPAGVIVLPVNTEPTSQNADDYPVGSMLIGQTGGSYFLYIVTDVQNQTNAIKRIGFSNY